MKSNCLCGRRISSEETHMTPVSYYPPSTQKIGIYVMVRVAGNMDNLIELFMFDATRRFG
jgi:hypothetical protein